MKFWVWVCALLCELLVVANAIGLTRKTFERVVLQRPPTDSSDDSSNVATDATDTVPTSGIFENNQRLMPDPAGKAFQQPPYNKVSCCAAPSAVPVDAADIRYTIKGGALSHQYFVCKIGADCYRAELYFHPDMLTIPAAPAQGLGIAARKIAGCTTFSPASWSKCKIGKSVQDFCNAVRVGTERWYAKGKYYGQILHSCHHTADYIADAFSVGC